MESITQNEYNKQDNSEEMLDHVRSPSNRPSISITSYEHSRIINDDLLLKTIDESQEESMV